jgi:hypothetical protein
MELTIGSSYCLLAAIAIVVLAVGGGVVRKAEANKKADRWISRRTEETWA